MANDNLLVGLPGFRDFYPEIWEEISFVIKRMKEVCKRYNYVEYEGPSLEPIELFEAKSGEGLMGEVFHVKDINGRHLVLRPEQTPTLARMLAKEQQRYQKPIRWFSIPRLFRDETPQKGRLREFWQLNADILGEESILADVEVIALAIDIVRACGLADNEFVVYVNNRKLLSTMLKELGLEKLSTSIIQTIDRKQKYMQEYVEKQLSSTSSNAKEYAMYFRRLLVASGQFLDKLLKESPQELMPYYERRDEIGRQVLEQELEKIGVGTDAIKTIISITSFQAKGDKFQDEIERVDIPDYLEPVINEFKQMAVYLDATGALDPVVFDFGLARGLDYYTGFVFEGFDKTGEVVRAIFGGGRYEDLVSAIGGEPLAGVGFGMGDAVILEILKSKGKLTADKSKMVDLYIAPLKSGQIPKSLSIANKLRGKYQVLCNPFKWKLKKHLEIADQYSARYTIIIGPRDVENKVISLRDMKSKETQTIPENELEDKLQELIK